jgi:hypothetical protein
VYPPMLTTAGAVIVIVFGVDVSALYVLELVVA